MVGQKQQKIPNREIVVDRDSFMKSPASPSSVSEIGLFCPNSVLIIVENCPNSMQIFER